MLLWLVMVLVFIVLLVGGTGYYFYAQETMEFSNIPEIKVGEVAVSASGFDYNLPVLGGVFYKHTAAVRDSALAQTVSTDSTAVPIVAGQEVGDVTVTLSRYSEQVFSGSLAEYESFRFSANGTYDCRIAVAHAKAQSDERPRAYGEVYYDCAIAVEVRLAVALSSDTVTQGDVLAVRVANNLDDTLPMGDTTLGSALNFIKVRGDYTAFLPIPYSQETGDYTVRVQIGAHEQTLPVSVEYARYTKINVADRTQLPDAEGDESAASVEQYRGAIWPLYETMSPVQLWDGKFMPPVTGTRRYGYGMGSVLPGATTSIRHAGVDYNVQSVQPVGAPNAGTVVFSGALGLTGNTVVIEHGGGIKSFLYHLSTLSVTTG
ncbi:MAG: M23 family metallopeptidase, partial [Pygmaiobacter sp.]